MIVGRLDRNPDGSGADFRNDSCAPTDVKTTASSIIGWREWVALPDLGVRSIKAKVDTGARTSALHAFELEEFEIDGQAWVRFDIHPKQRCEEPSIAVELPLFGQRVVRNSGGSEERRPVVRTTLALGGERWLIELTLTRRDAMGFRMLLGREAVRHRRLVDPGKSFTTGRPKRRRA